MVFLGGKRVRICAAHFGAEGGHWILLGEDVKCRDEVGRYALFGVDDAIDHMNSHSIELALCVMRFSFASQAMREASLDHLRLFLYFLRVGSGCVAFHARWKLNRQ